VQPAAAVRAASDVATLPGPGAAAEVRMDHSEECPVQPQDVAVEDGAGPGGVAPPQRSRLKRKQPPPEWYWEQYLRRAEELEADWKVRRLARVAFITHHCRTHREALSAARNYEQRREIGAEAWKEACAGLRAKWYCHAKDGTLQELMADGGVAPSHGLAEGALDDGAEKPGRLESRSRAFLLTWNGSWGHDCPRLQEWVKAGGVSASVKGVPGGVALHTLCAAVARSPELASVFEGFWAFVVELARTLGAVHVSAAMELSTKSETPGRLHLHCFLSHPEKRMHLRKEWWRLRFDDQPVGHIARAGRQGRSAYTGTCEGHYYLQMRKVGAILQRTSHAKGRDFPVHSRWPLGQWRQGKLTHQDVRRELIESRHRVDQGLAEVAAVEAAEAGMRAEAHAAAFAKTLKLSPFKEASPQERSWLAQYAGGVAPMLRYKVLVYDGPSRFGKTQRAEHWFGAASTLTINCQNVQQPNLREWAAGSRCRAILYDEGDWRLLWGNRKLMQAGPTPVLLSQSVCNQHAYRVMVHGVPMMLTSNAFWAGCDDEEGRAWVEANVVYVEVTAPTWHEEASPRHGGC